MSVKVTVRAEIDVDEQAWEEIYGTEGRSVVASVEDYIFDLVQSSAAAIEGAITCTGYAVHEAGER